MITNQEIESAFETLGKLMDLHGENSFKAQSYRTAAFNIGKLDIELSTLNENEIAAIPSIGKAIQEKTIQLIKTGELKLLKELLGKTPQGLLDMMRIKGLGPKKVGTIWKELGIESVGELEYACNENRLSLLKGFGEKTQQNVLDQIAFLKQNENRYLYANMENYSIEIESTFKDVFQEIPVSLCGDIRRKENDLEQIDILIGEEDVNEIISILDSIGYEILENEDNKYQLSDSPYPVSIHLCNAREFYFKLLELTAQPAHLNQLLSTNKDIHKVSFEREEDIYQSCSLPYIISEMRNGKEEFEWIKKYENKDLVEVKDMKGIIHNHSKWSDGKNTIQEMAEQCVRMNMEYLVMSDHSKSATYANGLSVERVFEQWDEIDKLNQSNKNFKIYKSIESDILFNGDLDYEDDVLKRYDCVIASVHSVLKMTEEKANTRLIKAIENPYTTILGHPTGRLLTSRAGYPINHKLIIDACAANNVIIELNANPWRLDIDWQWIYYAMEKGVMISVNPDAHSIEGINDIHYGIIAARKGGLVKNKLFNAKSRIEMDEYLNNSKK